MLLFGNDIGNSGFNPLNLTPSAWYNPNVLSSITKAYQNISQTGTGVITTNVITASSSVATAIPSGNCTVRIAGTDIYTVSSISTTTINTIQALTSNYIAGSALAVDSISQLNDLSGNANHALQATAANQPIYGINPINTRPGFLTLGSGRHFSLTSPINLAGAFTLFVVNYTSTASGAGIIFGTDTNANTAKIGRTTTTSIVRVLNGGSTDTSLTYPTTMTPNLFVISRNDANKVDAAFNGAAYTRLFSDVAQSGTYTIGALNWADATNGQTWNGGIGEVIIYPTALTLSQVAQVSNYLLSRWGIAHA